MSFKRVCLFHAKSIKDHDVSRACVVVFLRAEKFGIVNNFLGIYFHFSLLKSDQVILFFTAEAAGVKISLRYNLNEKK